MVAVKSHQAESYLKAVERLPAAVLLYGTDPGLVSERALMLSKRLADAEDPAGEIIRIDDADLENDSARLAIELQTVAMFGGRKIVRAIAGRRVTALLLKPLVEDRLEGFLVVEAGSLRPDDALRTLFEKSAAAAAVACFPDDARDLGAVIAQVMDANKLVITPGAKAMLIARLGADRALSRVEIEKLALYAFGKGTVEEGDVEMAVGDAAELAIDRVVMAAGAERTGRAVVECGRSIAAGEGAQTIVAALQRHFLRLHRIRSALDDDRTMDDAMRQLRPPPHFKQKEELERQARTWTLAELNVALTRIGDAAKAARLNSGMEEALTGALLLDLGALRKRKV